MIQIERVRKVYNATGAEPVVALEEVSVAVADNEFVTLVGPSGCGKSTC
jgi:ABC-type sugar transport system ATPase subunit